MRKTGLEDRIVYIPEVHKPKPRKVRDIIQMREDAEEIFYNQFGCKSFRGMYFGYDRRQRRLARFVEFNRKTYILEMYYGVKRECGQEYREATKADFKRYERKGSGCVMMGECFFYLSHKGDFVSASILKDETPYVEYFGKVPKYYKMLNKDTQKVENIVATHCLNQANTYVRVYTLWAEYNPEVHELIPFEEIGEEFEMCGQIYRYKCKFAKFYFTKVEYNPDIRNRSMCSLTTNR